MITKSFSIYNLEKGKTGFIPNLAASRPHIYNLITESEEQEGRGETICSLYQKAENGKNETSRRTVLICDDERDLLLMFAIELETKYNVITAESGEECIQKYVNERHKGRKVDLILLDYRLGDIMGDVVARKIKELNDVKIILISAYDLDQQMIYDLKENEYVVEVLKKPFTIESLMWTIVQKIGN